ncbi:MAG TPA: hypothetical protein VFU21_12885 [Kofleriaceae bacterium]|nr:hypothetical protein [Kofleriaceae bacterium]
MDDAKRPDEELAALQRQVVLARFYLERFADPTSFVWVAGDKAPHELAAEALKEMDAQGAWRDPAGDELGEGGFPRGTARMPRLVGGRAGFVEFHQLLARQALDIGRVGAARAALWVLRASDFSTAPQVAEVLLAVLHDSNASDEEIAEAALRLTRLEPSPSPGRPR